MIEISFYYFRALSSRTRRPDRAVYVPRAKRSQTTPPASSSGTNVSPKSLTRKSDKSKSKSIDENHSTSNSEDACDSSEVSNNQPFNAAVTCDRLADSEDFSNCDWIDPNDQQLTVSEESTNEKNQKNLSNLSTMSEQTKVLTIENAGGIDVTTVDKDDKDELELIKASQEINRSNRKLIKQTFNSNVLEIEAAGAVTEEKVEDKAVNKDEDDWDTL